MLQAVFHESTLKAGTKRAGVTRMKKYTTVLEGRVDKRKAFAKKHEDYAKMLDRFKRGLR